jgi:hypothetical protein
MAGILLAAGGKPASGSTSVTYQYWRWKITEKREGTTNGYFLASEARLSNGGSPVSWPGGTTVTITAGGAFFPDPAEEGDKLVDNVTTYRMQIYVFGALPLSLDINAGSGLTADGFQFATSGGFPLPDYDPTAWELYGSNDGSTWTLLQTVTSGMSSVPTARETYTSVFSL